MRRPLTIIAVCLIGLIVFPYLILGSCFRIKQEVDPKDWLATTPVSIAGGLDVFRDFLGTELGQKMADHWGRHLTSSGPVTVARLPNREDQAYQLNQGLEQLKRNRLSASKSYLYGYYAAYMPGIGASSGGLEDFLPPEPDANVLYALYRYNRAVLQFELAERNSKGRQGMAQLLREALYDLRRAVAATESLGDRGKNNYWGSGVNAWEGVALRPDHGQLPIANIYMNLALAYLRLGAQKGYPTQQNEYLAREQRKYSWGEDAQLTPLVNDLIGVALSKEVPVEMFRLIMALHNMEAAGRGLAADEAQDLHHYTVGILLNSLVDEPDANLTLNQVASFFQLALESSQPEKPVYQLALKELALVNLRLGRTQEAAELLGKVEVGVLEPLLSGPDKEYAKLFCDLAQLNQLATGDFQRVLNHLDRRAHEQTDPKAKEAFEQVSELLGESFFRALRIQLQKESASVQGSILHQLASNKTLQALPSFHRAFEDQCLQAAILHPGVATNFWLRSNPEWLWRLVVLSVLGFFAWLGYLTLCYQSHRKWAQRIFETGYGRD